jgi:hypothetical protein
MSLEVNHFLTKRGISRSSSLKFGTKKRNLEKFQVSEVQIKVLTVQWDQISFKL